MFGGSGALHLVITAHVHSNVRCSGDEGQRVDNKWRAPWVRRRFPWDALWSNFSHGTKLSYLNTNRLRNFAKSIGPAQGGPSEGIHRKEWPRRVEVGWVFGIVHRAKPAQSGDEMIQIDQRPHFSHP